MKTNAPNVNWIERLGKWRSVFAGWQLGTRAKSDPESQAVRDHRELTMALRAEVNALTAMLVDKGICTPQQFGDRIQQEAEYLCHQYELRFPGFKATDSGMEMDVHIARDTMQGWKP